MTWLAGCAALQALSSCVSGLAPIAALIIGMRFTIMSGPDQALNTEPDNRLFRPQQRTPRMTLTKVTLTIDSCRTNAKSKKQKGSERCGPALPAAIHEPQPTAAAGATAEGSGAAMAKHRRLKSKKRMLKAKKTIKPKSVRERIESKMRMLKAMKAMKLKRVRERLKYKTLMLVKKGYTVANVIFYDDLDFNGRQCTLKLHKGGTDNWVIEPDVRDLTPGSVYGVKVKWSESEGADDWVVGELKKAVLIGTVREFRNAHGASLSRKYLEMLREDGSDSDCGQGPCM